MSILSSYIVFPRTILWIFSFYLSVIYFWLVCPRQSDHNSLILILVLGSDWNVSVGRIIAVKMDLISLQAWGRSWWGFRLGVQYSWNQLIFSWYKIPLKFTSKDLLYLLTTYIFCINWISVHWYWKLSLGLIVNFL